MRVGFLLCAVGFIAFCPLIDLTSFLGDDCPAASLGLLKLFYKEILFNELDAGNWLGYCFGLGVSLGLYLLRMSLDLTKGKGWFF